MRFYFIHVLVLCLCASQLVSSNLRGKRNKIKAKFRSWFGLPSSKVANQKQQKVLPVPANGAVSRTDVADRTGGTHDEDPSPYDEGNDEVQFRPQGTRDRTRSRPKAIHITPESTHGSSEFLGSRLESTDEDPAAVDKSPESIRGQPQADCAHIQGSADRPLLLQPSPAAKLDEEEHVYPSDANCEDVLRAAMTHRPNDQKAFMFKHNDVRHRIDLCFKETINSNVQTAYILPSYTDGFYMYNRAIPETVFETSLQTLHSKIMQSHELLFDDDLKRIMKPRIFIDDKLKKKFGIQLPDLTSYSRFDPIKPDVFYVPLNRTSCGNLLTIHMKQGHIGSGSFFYAKGKRHQRVHMCYLGDNGDTMYSTINQYRRKNGQLFISYTAVRSSECSKGGFKGEKQSVLSLTKAFEEKNEYIFSIGSRKELLEPRHFVPRTV